MAGSALATGAKAAADGVSATAVWSWKKSEPCRTSTCDAALCGLNWTLCCPCSAEEATREWRAQKWIEVKPYLDKAYNDAV